MAVSGKTGGEDIFRDGKSILEYFKAAGLGGRGPVADDLAVKGDYGLEYSVVAVGFAGMLGRKDDITALVADEIFIIRSDKMNRSGAESSGAGGFVNIELTAFPRFLNEFVTNDFDSFLTVADIQAGHQRKSSNVAGEWLRKYFRASIPKASSPEIFKEFPIFSRTRE